MPESSLSDRYHRLLAEYISQGDERQLREIVALSHERGLALETTSGRVASSVRAVLSAYASIGAESMVVEVDSRASIEERRREGGDGERPRGECRVTLSTPELGGDSVVIEIRGRCPDEDLPIVRLDYVGADGVGSDGVGSDGVGSDGMGPDEASSSDRGRAESSSSLHRPVEPRQLYDVLIGLLSRDPDS